VHKTNDFEEVERDPEKKWCGSMYGGVGETIIPPQE
jgi:hypothetical protein